MVGARPVRWQERLRTRDVGLLAIACGALAVGWASLFLRQGLPTWSQMLALASVPAAGLFLSVWTSIYRPRAAYGLIPSAVLLAGVGMLFIYRMDPSIAAKQGLWILMSAVVFAVTDRVAGDVVWLARYRYTWAGLGLALVGLTFVFGTGPSGSRLWLNLGLFHFQPSEAMKVLLCLFLASYLADNALLLRIGKRLGPFTVPAKEYAGPLLTMVGLSLALLAVQGDLGPALILFGTAVGMIYAATGKKSYVILGALLFALGSVAAYLAVPRVRARFEAWLDPWQDPAGAGYQVLQAIYAVVNGGLYGSGLGAGTPWLVPAAHTDMIFPAMMEEIGLAGGLVVLLLLLCYVWLMLSIALGAREPFCRLAALGLTLATGLQAIAIVGGSIRLLPLTGVTVPFVSYGGSSLVINFAAMALVMAISHRSAS